MSPYVIRDNSEVLRERRDLLFPVHSTRAKAVDEKHRVAAAGDLVVDVHVAHALRRHRLLSGVQQVRLYSHLTSHSQNASPSTAHLTCRTLALFPPEMERACSRPPVCRRQKS